MPTPSVYLDVLLRTRQFYLSDIRLGLEREYYRLFARMLLDLYADADRGAITAERAEAFEKSIKQRLGELANRLRRQLNGGESTAGLIRDTARLVGEGHAEAYAAAARSTGRSIAGVEATAVFNAIPDRTIALMLARERAQGLSDSFKTLIQHRIRDLAPDIDAFLVSTVARGVSWQRSAVDLAKIMSRDNASVLKALENLGPRGGRLRNEIARTATIPDVDLRDARQLLHRARRIVITETNQAYQSADIVASRDSPVVDLLRWEVSGRHATLPSSPDVCDVMMQHDSGYGPGLFVPETCPSLLHPYCQCRTSKVLRPASEWNDPKRAVVEPKRLSEAHAQRYMQRRETDRSPTLTPARVRSQTDRANRLLEAAYDSYLQLTSSG